MMLFGKSLLQRVKTKLDAQASEANSHVRVLSAQTEQERPLFFVPKSLFVELRKEANEENVPLSTLIQDKLGPSLHKGPGNVFIILPRSERP